MKELSLANAMEREKRILNAELAVRNMLNESKMMPEDIVNPPEKEIQQ
jgi:hypothetical protein